MKLTAPPTDRELDYIKWEIWEPLRRRRDYQKEFEGLYRDPESNTRTPGPEEEDAFSTKWGIGYPPIDPNMSFEDLLEQSKEAARARGEERIEDLAQLSIQLRFHRYTEEPDEEDIPFVREKKYSRRLFGDDAAFVDPFEWIVNGKYLRVYINLERSRRLIEQELERIITEWLPRYKGQKKKLEQLRSNSRTFKIWDMWMRRTSFKTMAHRLNESERNVRRQHKHAWRSIYPDRGYSTRPECAEPAIDPTESPCRGCPKYNSCKELCPELNKILAPYDLPPLINGHQHRSLDNDSDDEGESRAARKIGSKIAKDFLNE